MRCEPAKPTGRQGWGMMGWDSSHVICCGDQAGFSISFSPPPFLLSLVQRKKDYIYIYLSPAPLDFALSILRAIGCTWSCPCCGSSCVHVPCKVVCSGGFCCVRCMFRTKSAPNPPSATPSDFGPRTPHGTGGIAARVCTSPNPPHHPRVELKLFTFGLTGK